MQNLLSQLKIQLLNRNPLVWVPLLLITTLFLLGLTFLRQPTTSPLPASDEKTFAPARFSYPNDKVERMLELVEKRSPLPPSDEEIRNQLTASGSSILYETPRFIIEYVEAPNSFMVGIKTIDIDEVRQDATQWFIDQGITPEGLCHLPVVFYPAIPQNSLPDKPLLFDLLPDQC